MTIELTYHLEGDYLIPDVVSPSKPKIGVWGLRRKWYLQKIQNPLYTGMLLAGTLNTHLEDIDKQAEHMLDQLIDQMAKKERITEELKSKNQLAWIAKMNSIQARAIEIVNHDLIIM